MNLCLQLIVCGLLANGVLSIIDSTNRAKRHIWRGNPNSQIIDEPRFVQTKTGHKHPAALHHQTLTPKCGPYENGIKAHPYSCQMYITCLDGELTVDTCSEGFLFDPVILECDFASTVTCSLANGQSARLQSSYQDSHRVTSHHNTRDATEKDGIGNFKCPREGLFEHPYDCTRFIQCSHAGLFVQSCGPGTMFNPSLLVCDWPKNVRCNKNGNGNVPAETTTQKSEFSNNYNQRGHQTRPVEADYDFDFDVRMSDRDSHYNNNNNNDQQHRAHSTSPTQNEYARGNYHRSDNSFQSHNANSRPNPQYSQNGIQTPPSQTNIQHPLETGNQYTPSRGLQPPLNTPPKHISDSDFTQQQEEVFPGTSQSRTFQTPSRTNVQYPAETRPQYTPSRGIQPPLHTLPEEHTSDSDFTQQQQEVFPGASQSNGQYQPRPQHTPSRSLQPDGTQQQQEVHPSVSQSRTYRPETNRQENFGILTVQPLANPRTQQNGNFVHSSPSYSKTKIYSTQQSHNPDFGSNYPSRPSNQYSNSNHGGAGIDQSHPVSRQLQNVDQTMDLLDAYANFEPPKRFEGQNARANVMTIDRTNSDKDHEVPIYNRPINMRFAPKRSDDLETEGTQHSLAMNDALKLMLSPYTKNAQQKNADVDDITTKILSNVADGADILGDETTYRTGGIDDAIASDEPIQNFNENYPKLERSFDIQRSTFDAASTRETETLPDIDGQAPTTKIGRIPSRTNSLVNDDQNEKKIYYEEVVEQFCSTGFDCGNGVCLSSEKICDGRNDCGNRLDERSCKDLSYDLRLSGDGNRQNAGRIEVKVFDKWGGVCGVGIGIHEASVFCREAGYPLGAVEVKINSNYQSQVSVDDSPNYILDQLRCSGNETFLKDCAFNGWDVRDCSSEETVGVVCKLPDMKCPLNYWLCDQSEECVPTAFICDSVKDCADGSDEGDHHCNSSIQYRLGNQKDNRKEGRVEVRYKGIWGTVCDDDFGENEAKVFCRSLGYDGAAAVIKEFAEPGDGLIWLDQVSCVGNETSLEACSHFEWGENNCNHTEDVSVRCFERELDTHQKLTLRDPKSGFYHLNEIHDDSKREMHHESQLDDDHCGQIRVPDEPDNFDDQPVFKVIEGREAKRGHHPWQATLRVRGQNGKSSHWCGAVLISKLHVLTAAHCLIGFSKNAYFIRLGDHHSETPEDTEVEVFIEDWHIHEKFRKGHLMNNDIALVKLKSAVKFTDHIQPICLPTAETEYTAGKNCTISGWGSTQYGKSTPSLQLRSAHIPIMSQELCKQSHNHGTSIQTGMFCAGILGNVIDACDGDSGGPFVCQENEENGYHSLYGIISWGQRCGDKNKPGVYTKVSEYLPWIEEKKLL